MVEKTIIREKIIVEFRKKMKLSREEQCNVFNMSLNDVMDNLKEGFIPTIEDLWKMYAKRLIQRIKLGY